MAMPSNVLAIAAGEIGYSRWDDELNGTKYGREHAQLTKSPYFGESGVPYCNMFTSYVLRRAGVKEPAPGLFAYVPFCINAYRAAGQSVSIRSAEPGDLICFDFEGDGVAGHIGIVELNRGSYVQTIEGNTTSGAGGSQSNGGGVYRRTRKWDDVVAVLRPRYQGTGDAVSTPKPPAAKFRDIRGLQAAVRAVPDNVAGPDTRKRLHAVRKASAWGGRTFPYGVVFTQQVVNTVADGYWGDNSDAAHDRTTVAIQKALGAVPDAIWGPDTEAKLRTALDTAEQP